MSADNYIAIVEGGDGKFRGYMEFMSVDKGRPHHTDEAIFVAESIREAVCKVQRYIAENIVEYGYQFTNITKCAGCVGAEAGTECRPPNVCNLYYK
jgi:hypothetical protein